MNAAPSPDLRWAWAGALACFVLAASTGLLFRLAPVTGATFGLDLGHVRHAHSHLMYFGWVTPALMALVARHLAAAGRPVPHVRLVIGAAFATALVAYPPFLLYGYAPAIIGARRLPLSVIAAGLNVLAWYGFAAAYARATRGLGRTPPLRCFDLALLALGLATLGAWGLPVLQALDVENPALAAALTHVFLDVFSEGWLVLGVLGLAFAASGARDLRGVYLAAAGVPFTFVLGLPSLYVPLLMRVLGALGAVAVGLGLLWTVYRLAPALRDGLWRTALALLALKALAQLAAAVVPGAHLADLPGLRVLYLHLMLLGFVTLGLVAAARAAWGEAATRGHGGLAAAVGALLLTLLPLTALWPAAWRGRWALVAAAVATLGPVLAGLVLLTRALRSERPASPDLDLAARRPAP